MQGSAATRAPRREHCPRCTRPASACLCGWIRPCDNRIEVLLLQHPAEAHQAKGSARLLHLSLANSRLEAGERFEALSTLLPPHAALLYPATQDEAPAACIAEPPPCLVVLDGTWRQSRQLLRLNPALAALPRVTLRDVPASRYRIRKAHRPGQLATLEATCLALQQLEGRQAPYADLLTSFDGFVDALEQRMHGGTRPTRCVRSAGRPVG